MNKSQNKKFNIRNAINNYLLWRKQINCKHEKWNCDNQIRTIQCRECGKRAWIEEFRSLY